MNDVDNTCNLVCYITCMKKIYVITKFVVAHSTVDAIEKEKRLPVDNVAISDYSLGQWAEQELPSI